MGVNYVHIVFLYFVLIPKGSNDRYLNVVQALKSCPFGLFDQKYPQIRDKVAKFPSPHQDLNVSNDNGRANEMRHPPKIQFLLELS